MIKEAEGFDKNLWLEELRMPRSFFIYKQIKIKKSYLLDMARRLDKVGKVINSGTEKAEVFNKHFFSVPKKQRDNVRE